MNDECGMPTHHSSFLLHAADGGFELALGIDKEVCGRYHLVSSLQAVEHDQAAIHARAGGYFTRLEIATLFCDENHLVGPGIQYRLLGN